MFANTRADIADALDTVDGVTGHVVRPTSLNEGDAWPQLASITHGPGQVWSPSWRVFVVLPTDVTAAVERTDELFGDLTDALSPWLFVDLVEPVLLETEAGTRPALQVTGRSE